MIYVVPSTDKKTKHGRDGFTLIELMISILIIGLILGGAFYGVTAYLENARFESTKTTMRNMQQLISMYKSHTDTYPQKLEDLVKEPSGVENWRGPYEKKVPKDGWDKPFVYNLTEEGDEPYELYSYGGKLGKREKKEKRINVHKL